MESFDWTKRARHESTSVSPKDPNSSQSTDRASSLRSERIGSDPSRSSSSRSQSNFQGQQGQQTFFNEFNEITPIVSNSGSSGRHYQSTDRPRNRQVGHGHGDSKTPAPPRAESTGADDSEANPTAERRPSWFDRLSEKFGTVELQNKGSVARDHLALERTFLAWLRTSLAFASIGIAVTQLFRLNGSEGGAGNIDSLSPRSFPPLLSRPFYNANSASTTPTSSPLRKIGKPLGTTFIGIALLVLLIGYHRYFETQYWVIRGKFPASRGSVAIIAFVTGALIVSALVVILAVAPNAVET